MKTLLLATVLMASSGFTYAQTVEELRVSITKKLEKVNNKRASIVNLRRAQLLDVERSLEEILNATRLDRREVRGRDRNPRVHRNHYGRAEALIALESIENSTDDANSVFNLLDRDVNRGVINWEEAVIVYSSALRSLGGNGNTESAKIAYDQIVSLSSKAGITASDALIGFVAIARAENSPEDASKVFKAAMKMSISKNMNAINSLKAIETLVIRLGDGNTTSIISVFNLLASKTTVSIVRVTNDFLGLNELENSIDDAHKNFNAVLNAVSRGYRYEKAFKTMRDLTLQMGSGSTTLILEKFNLIYR